MKRAILFAGLALVAMLLCCLSPVSASSLSAPRNERIFLDHSSPSAEEQEWLLSEEHQHILLNQAAKLQAKAEAQALMDRSDMHHEATPFNTPATQPTSEEIANFHAVHSKLDPELEKMLSVMHEDQFPENENAIIPDLQGWADKRVHAELEDQLTNGFTIKSVGVDGVMLESKIKTAEEVAEEKMMEAALEQAADEGVAGDAYEAAFANQAEQMYASADEATEDAQQQLSPDEAEMRLEAARELREQRMAQRAREAHDRMGGYASMEAEAYPSMIERSAEIQPSMENESDSEEMTESSLEDEDLSMLESGAESYPAKTYPSGVEHSVQGIMSKLRRKIMAVAAKELAKHPLPQQNAAGHSFIASKSSARAHAKEGDQWWLQKAPFFLPPPPEWGPMPVTMYTSYYHKPAAGYSHLDYAHGIPLPHADALGMARRTYPAPPFEQPAAGASPAGVAEAGAEAGEAESFMEVSSEEHAAVSAQTAAELQQELEDAEAELEAEAAHDDTFLEVDEEDDF